MADITYGEQVEDLAEEFLSDDPRYYAADGSQKQAMIHGLSQDIQRAIESWFEQREG